MPRGRFYETFQIPAGSSGVSTTIHLHHDGERREAWRALRERARQPGLRGQVRDVSVNIPERVEHARIQEDARWRVRGGRRRDQGPLLPLEEGLGEALGGGAAAAGTGAMEGAGLGYLAGGAAAGGGEKEDEDNNNDAAFRYDRRDGWREGPLARDRHMEGLRQFRDALRKFYDQGEGDEPLQEFLAWIRAHMDPAEWKSPRPDPNRMNVPSALSYVWPNPRQFAKGYGLKTSAGEGNSSRTMASGSSGFRDSRKPQSLADLNALHRRHYAAKGPL